MTRRRVDELLHAIVALAPADRERLVAELTRRYRTPDARGRQPLRKTAPAAVKLAKRLSGRGLSLRRISAKLAEAGQLNENGQPYNAQSIRAMLRGPQKRELRLKQL
jgi:hypothetical protein